ncbi:MAG: hypothetical protein EAX90_12760 [Candidatus Heimdallarchaeota archaeon]|nr:hypothetical protein [Candidatus Heimdallarchaeota archaeon]
MVKLDHSKKKIGYFSKFLNNYHFIEMDLLSGDVIIKPRNFQEINPNFLWLKDDNTIILLEKDQIKNKWIMKIYNTKTDLVHGYLSLKGNRIELLGLSPDEREVCLFIKNKKKRGLYRLDFETKKMSKIISLHTDETITYYWVVNDKLFYTSKNNVSKVQSIWSMSVDGSWKEPIFEELYDTYEEIIGVAANGRLLALNVYDKGKIKSGLLEIKTGEIQYLPTINERITAISSNGEIVITINQDSGQYYLYKTSNGEKWDLPLDQLVYNLRFCIDDEFLVYTKYINNQLAIELFDLITLSSNPIFEIGKGINHIGTKLVIT